MDNYLVVGLGEGRAVFYLPLRGPTWHLVQKEKQVGDLPLQVGDLLQGVKKKRLIWKLYQYYS